MDSSGRLVPKEKYFFKDYENKDENIHKAKL